MSDYISQLRKRVQNLEIALLDCLEVESRYSTREATDMNRREVHQKAQTALLQSIEDPLLAARRDGKDL